MRRTSVSQVGLKKPLPPYLIVFLLMAVIAVIGYVYYWSGTIPVRKTPELAEIDLESQEGGHAGVAIDYYYNKQHPEQPKPQGWDAFMKRWVVFKRTGKDPKDHPDSTAHSGQTAPAPQAK